MEFSSKFGAMRAQKYMEEKNQFSLSSDSTQFFVSVLGNYSAKLFQKANSQKSKNRSTLMFIVQSTAIMSLPILV
jgi:hypothetical protein